MCYDSDGKFIHNFTQWDINQTITVKDLEFDGTPIFHFSNKDCNRALGVKTIINKDGSISANVPNSLLRKPLPLEIYLYIRSNRSGTTIRHSTIEVHSKPKPTNYEYTDNVDVVYIENIVEKIKKLESNLQTSIDDVVTKLENGDFKGEAGSPGKDAVTDSELDINSNNAISNSAVSTVINEILEQLKNGITTDFWKLKNVPFQPVPDAPNPPELLRVPQDLETGAYIFSKDMHILLNGESYYAVKGNLLYVSYDRGNHKAVQYITATNIMFAVSGYEGVQTINMDFLRSQSEINENIFSAIQQISNWFTPLLNAKSGQLVSVKSADAENITLELGGMDLPTALPSPNALTIKIGSESVVYDGSSAQTIEIADGNGVAY